MSHCIRRVGHMKNINYISLLFNNIKLTSNTLIKKTYCFKHEISSISLINLSFAILLITIFYTPLVKSSTNSWLSTVPTSQFIIDDELEYNIELKSTVSFIPNQTKFHSDEDTRYTWYPMLSDDDMIVELNETHQGSDSRMTSIKIQILSFNTKTELYKTTVPITDKNHSVTISADEFPPSTKVVMRIKIIDYRGDSYQKEIEIHSKVPMERLNDVYPMTYKVHQDRQGKGWGGNRRDCHLTFEVTSVYDSSLHAHRALNVTLEHSHDYVHFSTGGITIPQEPFPTTLVLFNGTYALETFKNRISGQPHGNGCWKDQFASFFYDPIIKTVEDVTFPNPTIAFEGFVQQTLNRAEVVFIMDGETGEDYYTYYDTRQ